ncbi:hypothetical protein ACFPRB_03500 [Metabacillus niabensis]|uniref:Uncharacterized protein n=1 Tax=Metabacillus niabensis TaxID=324854 RepID=A0ABT9Z0T6_9BACI|nr:hypothetical protein [Metabacillus niabensis]MDQ0225869.1 hypothetical protein [Metabacillus niabensis]
MSRIRDIQRQFYNVYKEKISIAEFEKWLYKTDDIENIYGYDFYFRLLDLDYREKYIKNKLETLIRMEIPFGQFEQQRIVLLLEHIIAEEGDLVELLEQLYDDYCHGYSFLRFLGLTYITGIDTFPKLNQIDQWDKHEFERKREMLNSSKDKIIKEAKRLLAFFKNGKIKITNENEYIDARKEEDKVELHHIEKMFQ